MPTVITSDVTKLFIFYFFVTGKRIADISVQDTH